MRGIGTITLAVPLAAALLLDRAQVAPQGVAGAAVVPFALLGGVDQQIERASDDARLRELSNRLPNVRFLTVDLDGVSEWGLADLGRMRNLTYLVLTGRASGKVPAALAAVRDNPRLQGLNIQAVATLEDHQLEGVAQLEGLRVLQIGELHERNQLDDTWLRALRGLPNLRQLAIVDTQLTGWGVEELARLTRLRDLDLTQSKKLADGDLRPLARLRELEVLNLSKTAAGEATTDALSELRRLRRLTLQDTAVTDAAVEHLAYLDELEYLNLSRTEVTDRAVRTLTGMRRLRDLSLRGCDGISARGLAELERRRYQSLEAPGGARSQL